jgi:hypothetical protein
MRNSAELHPSFMHSQYLFRRKVFKLFGGAFHVYDEADRLVFYSEQKAFRLKEDFTVFGGEYRSEPLLTIKTPQILDIGATYHVRDAARDEAVGTLRRKAFKSIVRDEWLLLDSSESEVGKVSEESWFGAFASRFIKLIPQTYAVSDTREAQVAGIRQHFNPFVLKYTMSIHETDPPIDRRLLVAAGILLAAIERRQD